MKPILTLMLAACAASGLSCTHGARTTMTPSMTRKALLTAPVDPARPIANIEVQEVTMAPQQKAPLHLHPCPTIGVVTHGTITFQIQGRPPVNLKPGDAFYEPADVPVARFDNDGHTPATFVVYYLLAANEHETVRILPH